MHLTNIADLSKFPGFLKKWKKKSVIKFLWNLKGFQIAKTISKKNKIRDLMLPVFKTHYKAIAINTSAKKERKKETPLPGWSQPSAISPGVLHWAALGQRTTLRSDLKPSAQPSPTHPFSGQLMGDPSHRKTGLDRQASLGDSHTAPQPVTPHTQRTVLAGASESPHLEATLEASARE